MKKGTILQYFKISQKNINNSCYNNQTVQSSTSNSSDSAVTSKNLELESPKLPVLHESSNSKTNNQLPNENLVPSTSACSVSYKVNKLPSSHHGLVRESNPIVNEREENANKMQFLCMSKVPQVSPQGNYESRSDQTAKDGPVVSKPALSKCEESSPHGKVGVPNQTNLNASERTKLGTKKGSFGVSNKAILEYMERYGDISKCNDKVVQSQKWKELTRTLNANTNTNWSEEQWKRKWRYLKDQCIKNIVDIENGLAGGANGDLASKLGYLARVLKITKSSMVIDRHEMESIETSVLTKNLEKPETQVLLPETAPTHLTNVHSELSVEPVIQADGSRDSGQVDREEDRAVESTTSTLQTHAGPQRRRTARRRWRPTLRRNERSTQADAIAEKFHTLVNNFGTEHFRLRQLELEQRTQFTTLFKRFVDLLENLRNSED